MNHNIHAKSLYHGATVLYSIQPDVFNDSTSETFIGVRSVASTSLYDDVIATAVSAVDDVVGRDYVISSTAVAAMRTNIESVACVRLMKFVINSLLAGVLCVIGFTGNTASYVVLGRDTDMLPVARFLLRSLAVADNAFLVVWFVNFSLWDLIVYVGLVSGSSTSSDDANRAAWLFFRMATYPILFITQTTTIWLTVLIAASRCLIVCRAATAAVYCSLKATRIGVAVIALLAVLYNVPRYFETTIVRNESHDVELNRTEFGRSIIYQLVYFDVLHYIISFFLPLLLLTFFNARLILVYRAFRHKRRALQVANPGRRGRRLLCGESSEQSVTLIMIVVILVFIVCNVPAKGVQIILNYRSQSCPSTAFFVQELSAVFELISSSVNFLVYCVFLRRFRQRFSNPTCMSGMGTGGGGGRSRTRRSLCGPDMEELGSRPRNVFRRPTGDGSVGDGLILSMSGQTGVPAVIYRRSLDF